MANLSDLTRSEQVLAVLRANLNQWIDGNELANEQVGGSEGLRRLRDLKNQGYLIQERAHPDRTRAIHQYRLVEQRTVDGGVTDNPQQPVQEPRPQPSPQTSVAPRIPEPPPPSRTDWTRLSSVSKEYRREFWIREPSKQRVVGSIACDMDGSRWFWALKLPEYKGLRGTKKDHGIGAHPEKVLGSGIVSIPGGEGMLAAMQAVEHCFHETELKENAK